jgi:hypothetical protein
LSELLENMQFSCGQSFSQQDPVPVAPRLPAMQVNSFFSRRYGMDHDFLCSQLFLVMTINKFTLADCALCSVLLNCDDPWQFH